MLNWSKKMLSKYQITILFLLFSFYCNSQEKNDTSKKYLQYFNLTREIPYLHLNKTNFIVGEELWLQAYVLNQNTKKLHQDTANLYCNIYNEKGEYKQTKLLYIKDGVAANSIKIDSTFTENTYYIKASTNWMRNFIEDEAFLQKFNIIGNKNNTKKTIISDSNYDLQLLPEGGHLVESTNAVLGIILKNKQNEGVKIKSGTILDDKNNIVRKFTTNQFGLGKIKFHYKPNTIYNVKVSTFDDEEITKLVSPAKKNGITLNVENTDSTFIKLKIQTNNETLKNNIGQKYYVYIHNTVSISKSSFTLKKNTNTYNFFLPTKETPKGINTITILTEDNKPVLERLVFNYDESLFSTISIKSTTKLNDSISIQLNRNNNDVQYLSASILPEETKSYDFENNILTKFLLKPYVKGTIEKGSYYFTNINQKKLTDLDLLLLNQGWSKYNWHNIFNNTPDIKFKFEKGITIKGAINSSVKDSTNIMLFSPEENLIINTPIIKNKFSFENIYLRAFSNISFSIQQKNNFLKPKVYTTFYPKLNKQNINTTITQKHFYQNKKLDLNLDSFIGERVILDEVTLESKPKKKNTPTRLFASRTSYKNTDKSYLRRRGIISFLTSKGFRIVGSFPNQVIYNNRGVSNLRGNKGAATEVTLDDMPIVTQDQNNLNLISNMILDDFEEIIISKNDGGQIYLYSNKERKASTKNLFQETTTSLGFAKEKTYYKPNYLSTNNSIFKNYGAIFWKPNIVINKENYSFKTPHLNQKTIRLYIEGITNKGAIIYEERVLTIN
ncbi:hypothetical protein LPB136_07535 [Tenacibaculum todarodis]|uniref:Macroglobulin domain-containing protein n=1 Tax=Tenacibaculum todarodis TaxID=1850252 RepID=A0A1L3JJ85_9FLAO|nr:hypothetical protein [Tenacibaculum todarodis]APG65205.1 hypothetical protein LPB136_07535 [Tenacibaculum todarodis]